MKSYSIFFLSFISCIIRPLGPICVVANGKFSLLFLFFLLLSILFFLKVGYSCYTILLVFAVQRSESAVCMYMAPPSSTSFPPSLCPIHLGHYRAMSWAPCNIPLVRSHSLSVLYMAVHMHWYQSPSSSLPLPPPVHTSIP